MLFKFVPMNEGFANNMVENWKYEGIYECYSYIREGPYTGFGSLGS